MNPPPTDKDEAQTRQLIDEKLIMAGWEIQDTKALNFKTGRYGVHGIAVREYPTATGPADYMLFIDDRSCGILKTRRLVKSDSDEFIELYNADDRSKGKATWSERKLDGRSRSLEYDELINRDKTNLDSF